MSVVLCLSLILENSLLWPLSFFVSISRLQVYSFNKIFSLRKIANGLFFISLTFSLAMLYEPSKVFIQEDKTIKQFLPFSLHISLLTLSICSCVFFTFSITALTILIIVIFNSPSNHFKICVISESGSNVFSFLQAAFSLVF